VEGWFEGQPPIETLDMVKANGLRKYVRKPTYSEVKWNYVYVDINFLALFPATGRTFTIRAGAQELQAIVNEKHRLKISTLKHFVRVTWEASSSSRRSRPKSSE
jgi:hypothetical protein